MYQFKSENIEKNHTKTQLFSRPKKNEIVGKDTTCHMTQLPCFHSWNLLVWKPPNYSLRIQNRNGGCIPINKAVRNIALDERGNLRKTGTRSLLQLHFGSGFQYY